MRALVECEFSSFSGIVTFNAGNVGTGSSGDGQGAGGTGAEAGAPPAMSRMDKISADMNKKVARPAGDVDAPGLRKDARRSE